MPRDVRVSDPGDGHGRRVAISVLVAFVAAVALVVGTVLALRPAAFCGPTGISVAVLLGISALGGLIAGFVGLYERRRSARLAGTGAIAGFAEAAAAVAAVWIALSSGLGCGGILFG